MSIVRDIAPQVLSDITEIAFAVLFGSASRGTLTSRSDVDLAVRFADGKAPQGWSYGGLLTRLEIAFGRRAQLVDLSQARSTVLRHEISRGVLVKGDPEAWIEFKVKAFRDFREFGPRYRRCAAAMVQRLSEEGPVE